MFQNGMYKPKFISCHDWSVQRRDIVFSEVEAIAEETGFVNEAECVLCETQPEYEETA